MSSKMILGIDPGSRITGLAIIQSNGVKHQYIMSGCIRMTTTHFAGRLEQIYQGIHDLITHYQPEEAAIEQIFMHENASSALKLGHARGVSMLVPALHQISIAEYSARQIKQAVVGYGAATKTQVQHMVKTVLKLTGKLQADAADALAVAICHAQMCGLMGHNTRKRISRGRR